MKSINTSSDFKNSDKNLGFISKIALSVRVEGVFNVPVEFKKAANDPKSTSSFKLCLLGMCFENGKVVPKKLTEDELKTVEEIRTARGPKKVEPPLPEDLEKDIPGLDTSTLSQYYDELENEYRHGSIRFLDPSGFPAKIDEDRRGEELLLLELAVVKAEYCLAYFIRTVQLSEEEAAKQRRKDPEAGTTVQYFCAKVSLQDLKLSDNVVMKGCFPLVELPRGDRPPMELRSPMYVKLEIRTDVPMGLEYKKKFNFDITDILKAEPKPLSATTVAQAKFSAISETLFADFEKVFEENLFDQNVLEAYSGFNLQKMDKNSQLVRDLASKAKELLAERETYPKFRDELRQLVSSFIYQKYKIKNFRGIYMNNNDKIYGQVFNQFQEFGQQFAEEKMAKFRHESALAVPRPEMLEEDHMKALAEATGVSPAAHFKRLSQDYFLIGDTTNAERAVKRAQKISPDDTEVQLIRFGQLIKKCDFTEAESTIFYAIGRVYSSWDSCFRMLLLFLERAKVKESVHITRYLIEKFPNDQLYFVLLWALLRKFLDSSSLIGYFQAKFNRTFNKSKGFGDWKGGEGSKDILRGRNLEQVLELDPFWYEFKAALADAALLKAAQEADPKKGGEKKAEKLAPVVETKPKKVLIPKPPAELTDEFIMKQATLILELGFPRTCTLLMDLIESKDTFEYQLLEYQIMKEDEEAEVSLKKLKDLLASSDSRPPQLVFEIFLRCDEFVKEGFLTEDEVVGWTMDVFEQLGASQQYSVLFRMTDQLVKRGHHDAAIQLGIRGVEMWPNSVPFWHLISECYFAKNDYQECLKYLTHANFLDNFNADVLVLVVLCLLRTNERCRIFPTLKDLKNIGAEGCRLTGLLASELQANGFEEEARHFRRSKVTPIEPN